MAHHCRISQPALRPTDAAECTLVVKGFTTRAGLAKGSLSCSRGSVIASLSPMLPQQIKKQFNVTQNSTSCGNLEMPDHLLR